MLSRIMWSKALYVLTICVFSVCESYRILVVFPFPGVSHTILGNGYVDRLLEAGHEVTYITAKPMNNASKKLRQIDVSSLFESHAPTQISISNLVNNQFDRKDYSFLLTMAAGISHTLVQHQNVQKLIHEEKEQFDAVLIEWLFSEVYVGLASVFNCPLIWAASVDPEWMALRLMDAPTHPAYTVDILSDGVPPLTFAERVYSLWIQLKVSYMMWRLEPADSAAYEGAFKSAVEARGRTLPPFLDMKYNASLMLGNCHVSSGMPVSLPQSYKPIGGHYIVDEPPLPEDLQNLMDNSPQGVIYFSMGTVLQSKDMPLDMRNSLLKMFGRRKETIIWKFEVDFPNLPENVHMVKFAPQRSILAHPNLRLFITHGGLLSTNEALYYGNPIIGIPGFADQHLNVNRAVHKGFAVKVNLDNEIAVNLEKAIEEVLKNPIYLHRAKELSFIYHDRPVKPGAEMSFWVRHVIETRGAPHLRSPALMVPWYQKIYLDLAVVVFVGLVVVFYGSRLLFCKGRGKEKMH